MSKAPKLRFKEFSGDWEHKRFGTVIDKIIGGGTPSRENPDFYNGTIPWLTVKDLKDLKYIDSASEFITELGLENSSAKLANENDLIIPTRMAVGRILIAKNIMAINQDLKVVSLKKNYNTEFMYYRYLNKSTFIEKLGVGSTVSGISMDDLKSIKFFIPSYEEQEKIASFFSLIDDKISLQGEKVEALKDYKKGMMQKIFSRELRFKDDEGRDYPEWEEKKITEVAKTSIGLVTTMTENYVEDGVKLIRNSDIKENKIKKDNLINLDIEFAAQNEHRKLKINDVVTVHTGDIGTSAVIDEDMDGCLGFATLNTRPDNNIIDSHYLCHYFNSFRNKKYAIRMSTGDGRSNYNLKDFNNANILIPCIEEQKKIVNVLSNIDLKLDKEQEKLDSLNEYKKGLLQQMFV